LYAYGESSSWKHIRRSQSDTREYAMWMQKGMEWKENIERSITNPSSIPAAIIFAMAMDGAKS
jgi:hypothetical protein